MVEKNKVCQRQADRWDWEGETRLEDTYPAMLTEFQSGKEGRKEECWEIPLHGKLLESYRFKILSEFLEKASSFAKIGPD